ncbi:hypothetical protein SAMN05192558_104194 [Actinokineospora alba]|uniref:DUF2178 domain-containing protein n=1 Tax=Actinokineospora alba TaxID=504798 RepID=A0A1H0LLY8_9PSEU|nr:hypothetical protein [Actinokineospora alba]TDP67370.1 hypothetical protein C8E96_2912 [Actinokineospora alba]SDI98613.1 hypothetical protein SAMN05421871_109103 [Actinokineospora alba]SDO69046.1 hypothetical protein SAMN05192558_104194 [Actinokineospora alba]
MAFEEKRAWIMLVVTVAAYAVYLITVLGGAGDVALADAPYVSTMLWTIGGAIVVAIVLNIVVSIASDEGADQKDQRDREIARFGDYIGMSFVVIGAVAALVMSMAEWNHFWIANVIYLGFALSAALGSMAKLAAYRRGFQTW